MLNIRVQNLKETRNVQNDSIQKCLAKIESLKMLQSNTVTRINNINTKFEALKGHAEKLYSILLRTKTKVSKTERDYHKQLQDWNKSIKRMVDTTDSLASTMTRIKLSTDQASSTPYDELRPPQSPFISPQRGLESPITGLSLPPRTPFTVRNGSRFQKPAMY